MSNSQPGEPGVGYSGNMMRSLNVKVLGSGTAGLCTALALARAGHRVTIIERDPVENTSPDAAFEWQRRGIPHFLQAHAFIPRGRKEMRAKLPDVYRTLLAAGAYEVDLRPRLPGPLRPEDEELAYVGVRRPLIEWALRRAVLAQEGVEVRDRSRIIGLLGTANGVRGVRTGTAELEADLVVDAMGRSSAAPAWLESIGVQRPRIDSTECGVVYYSRYYRVRAGESLPDGPWIPTPRAMLPYGAFSSFPGDNGTFAALLAIPPQDHELKVLRRAAAYEAAITTMPALHSWTSRAEPITDVLPMGSLSNTFHHYAEDGRPIVRGFVAVGDALCHSNPMFALGLAQSIIHAFALETSLAEHTDANDALAAYHRAVEPEALERYTMIAACDDARCRLWEGEPIDFAHARGAYQLFLLAAGSAAAFEDPDVFRAIVRRIGFLDRTAVLDDDVALQQRIETIFSDLRSKARPAPAPSREELLRVIRDATS